MTESIIKSILAEELFGHQICESVQDSNLVNYVYNTLLLERLLVGEPISVDELRKLLRKKIVNFQFIKLNGEVRPATGTTMMKYIPPSDHPKGIRPSSPKVATFYDLDKDAWRSVSRRSKEIVLKKDEKTDKPIIVVKDKSDIKVKPVSKERTSKDPIEQGQTYKYQTNRGTNTYVEILRQLQNGLYQVSSPLFKTTFAIDPSRIGDKFKVKEEPITKQTEEPEKIEEPKEPEQQKPEEINKLQNKPQTNIKKVEPVIKQQTKPIETKPEQKKKETTIILPTEIKPQETEQDETKAPPIDITPEENERPEDLSK